MNNFFTDYFNHVKSALDNVDLNDLNRAVRIIKTASRAGNKIIIAGNGGSAAMASHVSVDFTKVAGIRAINFNEPDLLTCFANDYGYDKVFEKAIKFYGDKGDVLILISSSGSSDNVVNAAKYANKSDIKVITFTGFKRDNPLSKLGKINFWLDCKAYNIVEMTHHIWLLSIVDFIVGDIYYSAA
jgi:D-sedoheptulose 7-phosphate isomerase